MVDLPPSNAKESEQLEGRLQIVVVDLTDLGRFRCFCFDADGGRIFGQEWWIGADNMTCGIFLSKGSYYLKENSL